MRADLRMLHWVVGISLATLAAVPAMAFRG